MGMVAALTGPAASLGRNMRAGVLAAFEEANRAGGINGRKLELLCEDDGYEPTKTGQLVRQLIDKDAVIGFVGNVGTPTGVVAMPICQQNGVPFVAPFTGAASLRPQPADPMVFHLRASYGEEIEAMVDALVDHAGLGTNDIAFFTQRDAYGDAGFDAGVAALRRRGASAEFRPMHVRYERNTLDVESALAECLSAKLRPRAIIMVGAYAPCGQFIHLAHESKLDALFLNVSFVGGESLAENLADIPDGGGNGVIVTQVVPTLDRESPLKQQFTVALDALPKEVHVEPCLGALEGFCAGRMICRSLARCEGKPSSAEFAKALAGLGSFDLGLGVSLTLDAEQHQACHTVWPSIIRSGKIVAIEWRDLAPSQKASTASHEPDDPTRR